MQRLRDAVVGRGREVEVTQDGALREIGSEDRPTAATEAEKKTKLADRTWGRE